MEVDIILVRECPFDALCTGGMGLGLTNQSLWNDQTGSYHWAVNGNPFYFF